MPKRKWVYKWAHDTSTTQSDEKDQPPIYSLAFGIEAGDIIMTLELSRACYEKHYILFLPHKIINVTEYSISIIISNGIYQALSKINAPGVQRLLVFPSIEPSITQLNLEKIFQRYWLVNAQFFSDVYKNGAIKFRLNDTANVIIRLASGFLPPKDFVSLSVTSKKFNAILDPKPANKTPVINQNKLPSSNPVISDDDSKVLMESNPEKIGTLLDVVPEVSFLRKMALGGVIDLDSSMRGESDLKLSPILITTEGKFVFNLNLLELKKIVTSLCIKENEPLLAIIKQFTDSLDSNSKQEPAERKRIKAIVTDTCVQRVLLAIAKQCPKESAIDTDPPLIALKYLTAYLQKISVDDSNEIAGNLALEAIIILLIVRFHKIAHKSIVMRSIYENFVTLIINRTTNLLLLNGITTLTEITQDLNTSLIITYINRLITGFQNGHDTDLELINAREQVEHNIAFQANITQMAKMLKWLSFLTSKKFILAAQEKLISQEPIAKLIRQSTLYFTGNTCFEIFSLLFSQHGLTALRKKQILFVDIANFLYMNRSNLLVQYTFLKTLTTAITTKRGRLAMEQGKLTLQHIFEFSNHASTNTLKDVLTWWLNEQYHPYGYNQPLIPDQIIEIHRLIHDLLRKNININFSQSFALITYHFQNREISRAIGHTLNILDYLGKLYVDAVWNSAGSLLTFAASSEYNIVFRLLAGIAGIAVFFSGIAILWFLTIIGMMLATVSVTLATITAVFEFPIKGLIYLYNWATYQPPSLLEVVDDNKPKDQLEVDEIGTEEETTPLLAESRQEERSVAAPPYAGSRLLLHAPRQEVPVSRKDDLLVVDSEVVSDAALSLDDSLRI